MPENSLTWKSSALLTAAQSRWTAMQPAQRRLLLTCGGLLIALCGLSFWWSSRTDWRVLYSGLDGRDAATLEQQLSAAGITYQATPDGATVQVPAEQLDKSRVAISTNGLPQSGRLGFELFDKPNWVGSEFDERVNFQRALEGELEHTIGSIGSVRSVRVHIVLPKQGAFASEDQPAKASAVLKLRRSDLPRDQSDAIRNLIAGAVEGLKPEGVTLVDADGHANFSPNNRSSEDREAEVSLQNKVIAVLEPLAGIGNVHATVSLSYVQGTEERTDEVYDPQSATPVNTQRTEQTSQANRAGGIAGTASNSPAAQPSANNTAPNATPGPVAAAGPAAANANGQTQTSREEISSFAVSKHVTHTAEMAGRVRRLTAAIVINDRMMQQAGVNAARAVWQHRSSDEMKRMQLLAQAAVGFDEKRGDQVVLEDIAFSGNNDIAPPVGLGRYAEKAADILRAQPTLPRAVVTGLGVLLLGLFVLRPLTRQTQLLLAAPLPLAVPQLTASAGGAETDTGTPNAIASGAPFSSQHIFERVSEHIRAEPQSSARLISSWIGVPEADG